MKVYYRIYSIYLANLAEYIVGWSDEGTRIFSKSGRVHLTPRHVGDFSS